MIAATGLMPPILTGSGPVDAIKGWKDAAAGLGLVVVGVAGRDRRQPRPARGERPSGSPHDKIHRMIRWNVTSSMLLG